MLHTRCRTDRLGSREHGLMVSSNLTCEALAQTVTGVKREIADATSTKAAWAGIASLRQLSGRCGQPIQMRACGSHSAGIWKPQAAANILSSASVMSQQMLDLRRIYQSHSSQGMCVLTCVSHHEAAQIAPLTCRIPLLGVSVGSSERITPSTRCRAG
jgi:hypothetical protein